MLIPFHEIAQLLNQKNIKIKGVFHVGAHYCEELQAYLNEGINEKNIWWVEGNTEIYNHMTGKVNIINAMVDEISGRSVDFKITNNGQSSSILELGTHKIHHSDVYVLNSSKYITKSIKDVVQEQNLDIQNLNFWNMDIQGLELRALKGAGDLLEKVDALYLEVNTEKVYIDCALIEDIDEYVKNFGFSRVLTKMTQWGWGDALYIKN